MIKGINTMRKKLLFALLMLVTAISYGQKKIQTNAIRGVMITCPAPDFTQPYEPSFVPPPASYLQKFNKSGRIQADRSKFIVTYIDFPDDAKLAFQKAVDIWQSIIVSDVPIRITAYWDSLGRNVLGAANASTFYRDFPGAVKAATFYPVALAERMSHTNLNGSNSDIEARFNKNFNWYLGADGNPPKNRQDFVSTVLHEIGHGLGFSGSLRTLSSDETQGIITNGGIPFIFDYFVENIENKAILNTDIFKNPSAALLKELTGGALFINAPLILQDNGGERGRLYAPKDYSQGSSYSHLDEDTYKAGTINALMTYAGANGEVNNNPGPIVNAFFKEMGWKGSSITHQRITDSEDLTKPIAFKVKLFSDTTYLPESVKLFYGLDTTKAPTTEVKLTRIGTSDEFSFTLPADGKEKVVSYYFTAQDNAGRTLATPAQAPAPVIIKIANQTLTYNTPYKFKVGADTTKPKADFVNNISSIFTKDIKVTIPPVDAIDNLGIDTVYVEYQINGVTKPAFALKRGEIIETLTGSTGNTFTGGFDFTTAGLVGGEKIAYRIVIIDKAKSKNRLTFPKTGFYEFEVQKIAAAVTKYSTNFESTPKEDFFLKGFGIKTPNGFLNGAIHSDHPYADGSENGYPNNSSDRYTDSYFSLLKPIILRSDTANIYFDEIALVEPGESGASFILNGSVNRSFFDYVIVEGSKDGGKTWLAFQDGWDANANSAWLKVWNSSLDATGNSNGVGELSLYKSRTINMLKSGSFKGGEQILIRFRMLADAGGFGWGWAVDNLNIQGNNPTPPKVVVLAEEPLQPQTELKLSPNPSTSGEFLLTATFPKPADKVTLSVVNLLGNEISSINYEGVGKELIKSIDLSRFVGGTYLIRMQVGEQVIMRKAVYFK